MFVGFLITFVIYSITLLRNWPKRVVEMVEEAMDNNPGDYVPLRSFKRSLKAVKRDKKTG